MRYPAFPARPKLSFIMMKSLDTTDKELNDQWQGGKRRVWIMAMFVGTMFLYAARSAVPLCMAAMSKDMSWDKEADGAVMSAFFWGYTPAQIIGGWLSDKYGGELVLGYAGIVWSLCTMIVPFLPAGPTLFFPPIAIMVISRVFTGLSQGLHYPSLTNIIVKRIPLKERSLFTSSIFSAGPVGTLLMGSAGSIVLVLFGWHSVFLLQGLVGLTWAWLWRYYATGQYTPTRTELSIGNIKMTEATVSEKAARVSVPYSTFFKHPGVW
ncbi:solute carrier family 17 member 9-like isoform X2 [Actinia tenebrosa]|nr:solute carrier family 17 member 9-like isoform X2 [Actinia tenebrosa]